MAKISKRDRKFINSETRWEIEQALYIRGVELRIEKDKKLAAQYKKQVKEAKKTLKHEKKRLNWERADFDKWLKKKK